MEQVQQQLVQTHVLEEQNTVEQEHQVVAQYQVDTTQLDVMAQETNVQHKVNVLQVTTAQTEYQMPVVVENIVVLEQQDAQI